MFAQRLKLARKKAGFSMKDLGARLPHSISAQAISKYEKGLMMPKASTLVDLGRVLGVSLDFLIGGQIDALERLEFRKTSRISDRERARAEALVLERLENYLVLESVLAIEPIEEPFSALANTQPIQNYADIEEQAMALRRAWDLGSAPIASLSNLLEDRGIQVIEADLPAGFDGLACKAQRGSALPAIEAILVSNRSPIERKRFNLAHEIGHRAMPDISSPDIDEEKAMHRFAAAFLMPADPLRERVGGKRTTLPLSEIVDLKWFYGVSAAAMLMRLRDIGCLSASTIAAAFRGYARAWRREEPCPIHDEKGGGFLEKPMRYEALVWRGLSERLFSPLRAAQLLNRPLRDIEINIGNRRM